MRYQLTLIALLLPISCFFYSAKLNAADFKKTFADTYVLIENQQYDSAIAFLQILTPQLKNENEVGEANFSMAYAHKHAGRPFKAIEYYLKAADNYNTSDCLSNTFENIGLIYKSFNQHSKAIHYFTKAIAFENKGTLRRMKKLYSRSTSFRRNDQTNEALTDLMEAEEIAYQTESDQFRAKIYNQLGLLFKFRGELGKAGSYYFKALQIAKTRDIYHNYGNLKKELGDTVAAESLFLSAMKHSNGSRLITTYIDLGEMYFHWNKPTQSAYYLNEAHKIYQATNSTAFNHVKLFEILAVTSQNKRQADFYKDQAIAEYKHIGLELRKSNDLFFGVIAGEKTQRLEIKREYDTVFKNHLMFFLAFAILTIILISWLVIRIIRGVKDRKIRKAFQKIEDVFYGE